jgi:protein involved in polysaccharide export with SLBB domain
MNLAKRFFIFLPFFIFIGTGICSDSPYLIGIEDVLEISVWMHSELDKAVTVRSDGKITFPPVGQIEAQGLQPKELSEMISAELKPYFVEPKVFVRLKEINSQKVIILGQVRAPGLFKYQSKIDLLELVSLAGGVTPSADLEKCILIRSNHKIILVNLYALLFKGDLKNNLVLQSGDTVIIPEEIENQFFVLGEVARPGAYEIKQGEEITLKKALAKAGGPSEYTILDEINVLRGKETTSLSLYKLLVENNPSQDITVQAGDTVFIPELTKNKVVVVGEVEHPGVLEIGVGLTVLEAITKAGGYTEDAVLKRVQVVRNTSEPQTITVDLEKVIRQGETDKDLPLKAGDVLFVPENTSANVSYVVQKFLAPLQLFLLGEQILYFSTRLSQD